MKNKLTILWLIMAATVIILPSCKKQKPEKINPAFREYIQAFTAGPVSVKDPIRIRLKDEFVDDAMVNLPVENTLFTFHPSIKGKLYWSDRQTLEFRPDEKLPAGQQYKAEFHLSKLLNVPDSLSEFQFYFRTMKQDMEFLVENHKAYSNTDLTKERVYGRLLTADFAEDDQINTILKATQDGRELPVTWIHEGKKNRHYFQVDSVRRTNNKSTVLLEWSGKPIGTEKNGEVKTEIQPLGNFVYSGAKIIQGEEKYILVQFSDPPLSTQNLEGIISVGKKNDFRWSIEDNELRIYIPEIKSKEINLSIDPALKNINGKTLGKGINEKLAFEDNKPAVRFPGEGSVLPFSKQLILPFEAVNVRAVDLKIIKIYENNILQFLQVNDLDGQGEMARVGKVVLKKTIPLRDVTDYSKWNRYTIDLSGLINPEEGALYCIRLSIKKSYSTWPCNGEGKEKDLNIVTYGDIDKEESREWYYYGSYDDYYYDESEENDYYDWNNRDNPCKSYYYNSKSVSRNILASNLGIIAKRAEHGPLMVVVADLLTTKPVNGAKIDIYNFQQQLIGSGITDGEGTANVDISGKPHVVVVKKDKQTGYLRLQEGKSLSLSMFDAGGEEVQNGLKGFLYGERGVWRPGDSLYLTFILDDKTGSIPGNHPVNFTLSNPAGQVVSRVTKTSSLNGFYNFSTSTPPDAPTGNWLAKVKIGNTEFTKTLKIETVKPNRLKINVDFGADKLVRGKENKAVIKSAWLTGAVAHNLRTVVNLTLTKSETKFQKFPGFIFTDPSSSFSTEKMTVFEGKLDENGVASFVPQIKMTNAAPGILKANFETTIYEEGGDFSVDRFSIPYYPFTSWAGIASDPKDINSMVFYTGRDNRVEVANADFAGNPVQNSTLHVEIRKLEWRWWWDNSGDNEAGFISTMYSRVTDSMNVKIANGRGYFIFNKNDDDWGRYFIKVTDPKSGHSAGCQVYVDWFGETHAPGGQKQAAAMLTFSADKEKYKPGDKVKLTIPSPDKGRALLTLENGSGILRSFWFNTEKGNSTYTFEVTPDMAPNCYAFVTLIQPHAQVANDLPLRLYGLIPIMVEDPASHLKPKIIVKEVIRPDENVSITVKEEKGFPMTYTLAMVDDGLLDLTRFKTPDPWNAFYAREALGVRTWDLYDQVIGAWSGELERILSIGGDKEALNKGALKANRFKPVVKFFGPFNLGRGGSKTHTFRMPQYVGSVRIMVVAGYNGSYGSSEKTVPVRKPLMVLGTMPRTLCPGETVTLPVTVFAMEKTVKNVSVTITPNNLFTVTGPVSKNIQFSTTGDQVVYFNLKVKDISGTGKVKISAVSGSEKAVSDIELDVRNPGIPVTEVTEVVINPGQTWHGDYHLPGIPGTNKASIEVSSMYPLNLEKRLGYLTGYPHGCLEQITSKAFPQLWLSDLIDLSESKQKEIELNIRAAIRTIQNHQLPIGGLTLWPGSGYADDWVTSYAGNFILEAQQKGYQIPSGFLSSWKEFQKQKAMSWKYNESWYNDDLIQAYRLYTLALAGSPETGSMNRLMERKDLSMAARWRLAAAYQLAGKPEAALRLINTASLQIQPYRQMDHTYGSDLRDKAMIMETLILMNRKNDAAVIIKQLSKSISGNEWMSTQTTSFVLMAISKYTSGSKGSGIEAKISIDNGREEKISVDKAVSTLPLNVKNSQGGGKIRIKNNGKNVLSAIIASSGIPPVGDGSSSSSNLKMSVNYTDLNGRTINPATIQMGTNFYAEVIITNPGTRGEYRQMALTQVMASGWEIINSRMSDFAASGAGSAFEYQDVRDDRVLTYFDIDPGKSVTFRIMLIASYPGHYYLPPVYCEAMYDNTVNARLPGQWVTVTEPGK